MKSYLEFERDIKTLEEELVKLKDPFNKEGLTEVETDKIVQIQSEIDDKLKTSYSNLNEWPYLRSVNLYLSILLQPQVSDRSRNQF